MKVLYLDRIVEIKSKNRRELGGSQEREKQKVLYLDRIVERE
jgi:hypothetical protein